MEIGVRFDPSGFMVWVATASAMREPSGDQTGDPPWNGEGKSVSGPRI